MSQREVAVEKSNTTSNAFVDSLEQIRPEFEELQKDNLPPITLDPVATAVTVRSVLPRLMTLRDELAVNPKFNVRYLDRLELYLHAWLRAQALHRGSVLPPETYTALVNRVSRYREIYTADAKSLIARGLLPPNSLDGLKGGAAHRNIAGDVLTLTTLLRSNWSTISERSSALLAELDEADASLDALLTDLGVRERGHTSKKETARERQMAYTLFVRAYDQIRRAVVCERWNEGDSDQFAPSLFRTRKKRSKAERTSGDKELSERQPELAPATGTGEPAPNGAAPPATDLQLDATKTAVGMPGSDPFTS